MPMRGTMHVVRGSMHVVWKLVAVTVGAWIMAKRPRVMWISNGTIFCTFHLLCVSGRLTVHRVWRHSGLLV